MLVIGLAAAMVGAVGITLVMERRVPVAANTIGETGEDDAAAGQEALRGIEAV